MDIQASGGVMNAAAKNDSAKIRLNSSCSLAVFSSRSEIASLPAFLYLMDAMTFCMAGKAERKTARVHHGKILPSAQPNTQKNGNSISKS